RICRLRIVQLGLGAAVARDSLELVGVAAGQDRDECRIGIGINLAGVVMGQGLGKARPFVGVARFVAVGPVRPLLLAEIGLRPGLTDAEGRYLAGWPGARRGSSHGRV